MMVVYKLWTGLYYLKVPFWGAWGERRDCRLVEFCFVFKKFASVCYYRISREGKQSSEEIPTVMMQSLLCPFLLYALGLCTRGTRYTFVNKYKNARIRLPCSVSTHDS